MGDGVQNRALRDRAHHIVHRAVRDGIIARDTSCAHCGGQSRTRELDAHHPNGYDDAHVLDVVWLCVSCHGKEHSGPTTWARLTDEERSARARHASLSIDPEQRKINSRRAGLARMANLTREERLALSKKAALASVAARQQRKLDKIGQNLG